MKFKKKFLTFLIKTIEKIEEKSSLKYKAVISVAIIDPVIKINRLSIGKNRLNVLLEVLYEKNSGCCNY